MKSGRLGLKNTGNSVYKTLPVSDNYISKRIALPLNYSYE